MLHFFSNLVVNQTAFHGCLFKIMVFHESDSHASSELAEVDG